jgi:O-antigen/teichoic acid export membrane protein
VSLKIAVSVGLPISIVTIAIAQPLLQVFGHAYASDATLPLQILMLGYLPNVVRYHYITVLRVEERLREAAVMLTVLAVLEAVGALVGAGIGGLNGLAVALVGVMWFEVALTAWPVARVIGFRLARS